MEIVIDEADFGMDAEAKLAEGLRLVNESHLAKGTKCAYRRWWTDWVSWCCDAGVDPLDATWEDVSKCLGQGGPRWIWVSQARSAIAFVYRARGVESPTNDRRLVAPLGLNGFASTESYGELTRRRLLTCQSNYLAWCRIHGRKPAPASGEQVLEFLRSVGFSSYNSLRVVSTAISLYMVEQGHPPTESHPLVKAWFEDLRAKLAVSEAAGDGDGKPLGKVTARFKKEWEAWRDAQGIMAGAAAVEDVLRYLGEREHERTAGKRVGSLRKSLAVEEGAFSSEEVGNWLKEFRARLERGEVPGVRLVSKLDSVFAEWSAARAARVPSELRVPVGLTREEVVRVQFGRGRRIEPVTLKAYASAWAEFTEWMRIRGGSPELADPLHVRVFVEHAATRLMVSTLRTLAAGIAYGFEEYGVVPNPVDVGEVFEYLCNLELERKEGASQMDPIRLDELKAIRESAFERRGAETWSATELRGTRTVALCHMMFDGLLRGGEAKRARWCDLSRAENGTGSLLLNWSKTDRTGKGECTFVSARTFQYLDRLRDLRRAAGKDFRDGDLIVGTGQNTLPIEIHRACAHAGLVGRYRSHSLRVGGAQELAVRAFSLPMIMLAGRWASPAEPRRYIRNIAVQESAMAQLQGMLTDGQNRLGPDARGIDVMSLFHLLGQGR